MGTRASISIKTSDGKFLKTTVNWDGYLSHVGKVLLGHYRETEMVYNTIKGGEIRNFGHEESGEVYVSYYDDNDDYFPIKTSDVNDTNDESYNYLYDPNVNKWYVVFNDYDELEDHTTVINMELGEALEKYGSSH